MKYRPPLRPLLALLSTTVAFIGSISGQTTPNPAADSAASEDADEMIVLSPFEITESQDNSYKAESTLAGNRLNTKLRDVGSAISVITSQMLRDIGATNNETLLQYTTNSEVGNIYGNMANVGSGQVLDEKANLLNPNGNTRIRGLASADNTIDFFLTDIPWNSYNTNRVDIQRGPNAILFGLGSPAGIINAGTNTAGFNNKGRVELRYSQWGSLRTTLDYNFVIIPKELAIRVDLLRDDEKFKQKPAFQKDQRGFGALRYEPGFLNKGSAKTIFRANYEVGKIRSNRPRVTPPGDSITQWFLTGTSPGFTSTGVPVQYNNLNKLPLDIIGIRNNNIAALGDPLRGSFELNRAGTPATPNPFYQPWLGGQFAANYFGSPLAYFEGASDGSPRLMLPQPTFPRGIRADGTVDGNVGGIPGGTQPLSITTYRDYTRKTNQPGAFYGFTKNLLLTDPTIFDFYKQLIDGPNKKEWQNFHRYNLNLAQTFFDGDVGIEAAYDKQHFDNGQLTIISDRAATLYIDIIANQADGTPNPNFGRPFVGDTLQNNVVNRADRESKRLTAFVKHDFAKNTSSWFGRALGSHMLTGFYNKDSRKTDNRNFARYSADVTYKDLTQGVNAATNFNDNVRTIFPAFYLGPSLLPLSSASGANIPRIESVLTVPPGSTIRVFDSTWAPATGVNSADPWENTIYPVGNPLRTSTQSENPANYRGWRDVPLNFIDSEVIGRDALTHGARLDKTTIESKALVYNAGLFNGALVGMYGYREDTAKAWTFTGARASGGPVPLDELRYRLPKQARDTQKLTSRTWSVVAHLTELLPKNPLPVNISVFYNKSENFAAVPGRVGLYGELAPAPSGNTKDQGIMIATKDDKYSLRINKFKSKLKNASSTAGFGNQFFIQQLITTYQAQRNIYFYNIDSGQDLTTTQGNDEMRWRWQPRAGQTPADADAEEAASIAAWDQLIASIPAEFFAAYRFNLNNLTNFGNPMSPSGLTITEDSVSKGYEAEFFASPVKDLRLTFNVSKTKAVRTNQGQPSWIEFIDIVNTALNTTAAGSMRDNAGSASGTALLNWNNNFNAPWQAIKQQEGGLVPELRKWRANFLANYEFSRGFLKGFNFGGGYRWQDKVIIGWAPIYLDANGNEAVNPQVSRAGLNDFTRPYYGPAEHNIDLWIGYKYKLKRNMVFSTQLNVANVGKGNYLIPITTQPDGTPAGWRIAPTQIWRLTNSLEF